MKHTLKFLVALYCSLSCLFNLYSQENFQSAYIVNLNNDTIKGQIDQRNWKKTPEIIRFKASPNSEAEMFKPDQIQSFGISNETYLSAIVTIDISPFRESELTYSNQPENKTDTVFLQVLIQGNKSLYYLKDENTKEHFFIDQDSIYKALFYKKYMKKVDEKEYKGDITKSQSSTAAEIKTIYMFRNQLALYFIDCPSVQTLISTTTYTKSDLIRLFKKYYSASDKQILYEFRQDKFDSEFGFLAGLSLTKPKFEGDEVYKPFIESDYPLSKNLTIGVFYNIIFNPKLGRWSLDNELVYTSYKFNTEYRDTYNTDIYTDYTISFGSDHITLNTLIKFKFPIKKMNIYLKGGLSNGIAISQTNYLKITDHTYSVTNIEEKEAFKDAPLWESGYVIGLSTSIKKFSIEGRFVLANGMSGNPTLNSTIYRYLFLLAYKI